MIHCCTAAAATVLITEQMNLCLLSSLIQIEIYVGKDILRGKKDIQKLLTGSARSQLHACLCYIKIYTYIYFYIYIYIYNCKMKDMVIYMIWCVILYYVMLSYSKRPYMHHDNNYGRCMGSRAFGLPYSALNV